MKWSFFSSFPCEKKDGYIKRVLKMDRPIGRKVLKFDSRLWRLRVVVAAAPQIKEGARLRRRLWPPIGGGLCKRVL